MDSAGQFSWLYQLYQLAQSQLLGEAPEVVQQHILQHIVQGFDADSGALALCAGDDCDVMTIVAGTGLPENTIGSAVASEESLLGWVIRHGEPVLLVGNLAADPRFRKLKLQHRKGRTNSSICWPLKLERQTLGALSINRSDASRQFSQDDLVQGTMLTNMIAIVIENLKLHIDQQEAHRQALQARAQLEEILGTLDSVVWSMTPDSFEMLFLNPAAEHVYGRAIGEFMAHPGLWLSTVHPEDRIRVGTAVAAIPGTGALDIEYRIIRPDGQIRWVHDRIHAVPGRNGEIVSLSGLGADVTQSRAAEINLKKSHAELQQAYAQLHEIQSQLLQSEKLASIGQLASGVAHEINNPIAYVYSNLGSLQRYLDDLFGLLDAYESVEPLLEAHADAVTSIRAAKEKAELAFLREDIGALMSECNEGITRVKKIVQDLKDFARAGANDEWQMANLHHGLESTLNIVNNELKYKADVVKDYGQIPHIECLPAQLNQVFMNLLVNATHAIGAHGTITIRTGAEENRVWIEVSDTGSGIAPENLNKIFDPFFTTKPVGTGTGLGLSVSYSIIQKHHGSIHVASELGKGTTFRVTLPLQQPRIPGEARLAEAD